MFEIVLFKAYRYQTGWVLRDANSVLKLKWPYHLWWFDQPGMKLENAVRLIPDETIGVMNCNAFRFGMAFVPNPQNYLSTSFLSDDYDGAGVDPFEEFLPQLVEIAQRLPMYPRDPADMCFYVLFDVHVDWEYDSIDSAIAITTAKWVGELDIEKLPLALIEPVKS